MTGADYAMRERVVRTFRTPSADRSQGTAEAQASKQHL